MYILQHNWASISELYGFKESWYYINRERQKEKKDFASQLGTGNYFKVSQVGLKTDEQISQPKILEQLPKNIIGIIIHKIFADDTISCTPIIAGGKKHDKYSDYLFTKDTIMQFLLYSGESKTIISDLEINCLNHLQHQPNLFVPQAVTPMAIPQLMNLSQNTNASHNTNYSSNYYPSQCLPKTQTLQNNFLSLLSQDNSLTNEGFI